MEKIRKEASSDAIIFLVGINSNTLTNERQVSRQTIINFKVENNINLYREVTLHEEKVDDVFLMATRLLYAKQMAQY